MNIDLLKILSDSNKDIDNQKLMDYVSGQIHDKDVHEVEQSMASSDFVNDAIEGLLSMQKDKDLNSLVEQLNKDLNKKLQQKKKQKEKRKIREYPWIYVSLALILVLAVISWFVIMHLHRG